MLANYLGKIALVDRCLGQLVEAMKQRGTLENALVILTADHGEMMGAHGYLTKGRFYEESARVPLVVRWPGHVQPGRTKALAQMMDVYPTIVEAIGGELSPGRFARSLLPVATGRAESVRSLAVSEIGTVAPLRVMARDARYKWWTEEDREFLFDLETDPLEQRNLAAAPNIARRSTRCASKCCGTCAAPRSISPPDTKTRCCACARPRRPAPRAARRKHHRTRRNETPRRA